MRPPLRGEERGMNERNEMADRGCRQQPHAKAWGYMLSPLRGEERGTPR
jgi:hypothetical protein